MIYLTSSSSGLISEVDEHLGVMLSAGGRIYNLDDWPAHTRWAIDNGCFTPAGKTDAFNPERWWAILEAAATPEHLTRCLFATAPDVYADADGTLARADPWLDKITALGYRTAYVAQPWQRPELVPWDRIGALFVGGPDPWQDSPECAALMAEAKARGLWPHIGRVNSYRRLRWCADHGADSADGTFLVFAPTANLPRIRQWFAKLEQPRLFPTIGPR